MLQIAKGQFFICYMVVSGLNLGHYQVDSLTHPLLISVFTIQSLRHWDHHKVPKPDQVLCGV